VGVYPDGEVQLHVAFLLAVLSLYPAAGLLDLYAGGVDGDGDGVAGLPEAPVGVDGEGEDASPESGVVSCRVGGY
jgi:hypothetical protein